MTVNRGLWVPIVAPNVGTTELEARLADAALFESNNGADPRSGLLHPQSATIVTGKANMSYDIAACNPVINRVAGEGVYRFSATGVTNVPSVAAPAANSRIDIIWVKQNDASKGDANNLAVAGVTNGAVAASPQPPAIPTGALELARATVGPNITGTTAASITQTFRHTALKGDPIPVRGTTERAEVTAPRVGQRVARLDTDASGQYTERWTGAAWAADPYFSSASPVNDGFWTMNGNLVKSAVGGRTQVSCSLELIRTGASFDITPAGSTMIIGLIPAGFRPPGNFSFVASEITNLDARYAEPEVIINSGGSLVGRSVSGGNISMAQGYKIYLSAVWFQ